MDQAKGLRQIAKTDALAKSHGRMASRTKKFPRVFAVTSGKGGVGKTNIVGNLAVAMTQGGKRVVIIDADVGLANIDIVFNLRPEFSIRHVVSAEKKLDQVMVKTHHGIGIVPGGSGFSDLTQLNEGEKLTLLSEFETLVDQADIIFVDTGAGISSNVLYFNAAADECIVVATTEPTSITDAYALMKVMSQKHGTRYFKLIVNMVDSEKEAKRVYLSLSNALDKFLKNVVLEYTGYIPFDRQLQRAVQKRGLLLDEFPDSKAANALEIIASNLLKNGDKNRSDGNLTFFMNRVFQVAM
ncbi:MAG: MinD/ParA family protein [Desulfobacteraceae bacterium]|nr:MinD/ParA family protein [Desulfobacteraceae bacterium]